MDASQKPTASSEVPSESGQSKQQQSSNNISDRSTLIINNPEREPQKKVDRYCLDPTITSKQQAGERSTLIVEPPPPKSKRKPDLSLNNRLVEYFHSLNKEKLWDELLNRLLKGKIGRIYLKSGRDSRSILCFENGVKQLSIDNVDREAYQYLIQKLKSLSNLPANPVEKVKKFEMQRWYKQERILLCFQLRPGQFAEEGTLQILRGQALTFYQQQQMDELGREALKLSQQLERKLKQIQLRSRINPQPIDCLAELRQTQQKIVRSLQAIEQTMNS
ncbi:MAG: hypothetical protein QNJ38_15885 [Prochloraceae cyanobacterium]|nr:hypothetical protein [Prochloraceae cyanobacterium]